MSRRLWKLTLLMFVLGALLTSTSPRLQGQAGARGGEWRYYGGDTGHTRYAPLDQINAANFNTLEVAWRFKTDAFGPYPEYKLEGTPIMVQGVLYTTAGTRRSVIALDAKSGELIWSHSLREGERAANAARQLSGRGVSYWTDGRGDERIIYVTTGFRLVELNAKTGAVIPSFGTNGMVDLKVGAVFGNEQPIDLENGERYLRRALRPLQVAAGDSYSDQRLRIEHRPEGVDLASPAGAAWLDGRITANEPELLAMGPLYKMAATGDPKEEIDARRVSFVLDQLRVKHRCAVVIEGHMPYGTSSGHRPK